MFLIAYVGTALIITIIVMGVSAYLAKRKGKNPAKWALLSAFGLFVFMFWDYYPTKWTHQYYCEKEAGFWVYKTLDQWKAENPGVAETLTTRRVWPRQHSGDTKNYVSTSIVNQRFNYVNKKNGPLLFNTWQHAQEILDSKAGVVLARQIDFSTGNGNVGGEPEFRFWIHSDNCIGGRDKAISFVEFFNQFKGAEK